MEKIYIGKIVNTFGIKGELKISSSFELPEKVFFKTSKLIINDKEEIITNTRYHKGNYLVEINNIKNINLVTNYIGNDVYFDKESISFSDDEFLYKDLIGLKVTENGINKGIVTDTYSGINPLIKVDDKFYIPLHDNFIIKKDFKNNAIICQNLEGLLKWK